MPLFTFLNPIILTFLSFIVGEEKKTVFGENKIGTIYTYPHPQNADCGHKDSCAPRLSYTDRCARKQRLDGGICLAQSTRWEKISRMVNERAA